MVRYGLAKVLRGVNVKALQTRKKSADGFENLLLRGLMQTVLKIFKVNFVVVVVVVVVTKSARRTEEVRKLRSTIN